MTEIEEFLAKGGKITKVKTRPMKPSLQYNLYCFPKSDVYNRGRQKTIFDKKTNGSYAAMSHI